jgi:hypothetical protein
MLRRTRSGQRISRRKRCNENGSIAAALMITMQCSGSPIQLHAATPAHFHWSTFKCSGLFELTAPLVPCAGDLSVVVSDLENIYDQCAHFNADGLSGYAIQSVKLEGVVSSQYPVGKRVASCIPPAGAGVAAAGVPAAPVIPGISSGRSGTVGSFCTSGSSGCHNRAPIVPRPADRVRSPMRSHQQCSFRPRAV